jgi:outer membrane immunogenic protein
MKLLKVICLVTFACVLTFGQTVPAADSEPPFNWTGPYVGIHVGYGWGDTDTSFSPLPSAARFSNLAPATLSPNTNGVAAGIQGGYNYQMGCFVVGIEADFSGSGMSGTQTVSPIIQSNGTALPGGGSLTAHQEINWFGTLRPRLGYAVTPGLLIYGTGGLAYGDVSYSANTDFRPGFTAYYPASAGETKVGWSLGAGVEYAFSRNWTVKTEYLRVDLGNESVTANPNIALPPFQVGYKFETSANILNIGLNYRF